MMIWLMIFSILFGTFLIFSILYNTFDYIRKKCEPKRIKRNCSKGNHDYVTEPMNDSRRKRIFDGLRDKKEDKPSQHLYNQFMNGEISLNWNVCKHCGHKTYDIDFNWDVINKQKIRDKKIDDLLS